MLQAILWDNDGVLVDTERLFYEANRDLFRPLGLELTEQHFFDWYLADNRGAWHLLEPALSAARMEERRAHRNRVYALRLASEHIPAIAGVAEVLASLAPRVRMAVVTSSIRDHFDIIHGRLPLRRHFEFVLTHESYANSKPAPDPYLLGLERLGVAAADALVVEDSPRGLRAAMAAGIRCVILRNALTRGYDFPGAYRVVDTMAELLAEIELLLSVEN
ncbi:HAD family hydrolase [Burkholderia sp. LMU1-1-1.1]|uniref:HAD family hydrolase n=1 Tax=Burkholderia sp. LMU1-1-1.1 TaxID=3135266 RepID=UPI003439A18D